MENIKLNNIELVTFDKQDKNHLEYLKKLLNDETIKSRFQGIFPALLSKENFFGKGFFIDYENELVGYAQIGKYNKEERCVYILGGAIDKNHRGKKIKEDKTIGDLMLDDITNYILYNYKEVEQVKLTISDNNIPAIKHAIKCGYKPLTTTHYGRSK